MGESRRSAYRTEIVRFHPPLAPMPLGDFPGALTDYVIHVRIAGLGYPMSNHTIQDSEGACIQI